MRTLREGQDETSYDERSDPSLDATVARLRDVVARQRRIVVALLPSALAAYWGRSETDVITITSARRDYILRGHTALEGRERDFIRALQSPAAIRQDKSHARRVTLYAHHFSDTESLLIVVEDKTRPLAPAVITAFPVHLAEVERRKQLEPLIWEE